jgi:4-phytase/acid phosphatase
MVAGAAEPRIAPASISFLLRLETRHWGEPKMICFPRRAGALLAAVFCFSSFQCRAQLPRAVDAHGGRLQYVIYLSRHGVRSPTGDPGRYDAYSAAPWPKWTVPPGYLTAHGFELMKLFGAYDRDALAAEGLLSAAGCTDAAHVSILADSDERTRETGKALAEGMFPGCEIAVHARPQGEPDPLFHAMRAGVGKPERALALAAIEGRVGGSESNLTEAYRPQLQLLDRVLAGCGRVPVSNPNRLSIFDAPASGGKKGHGDELQGPLNLGASMAETLLLEYTEGMKGAELGWGCLKEEQLREIMQLHEAHEEYSDRTLAVAPMQASNLLDHVLLALEQSATGKPVAGAPGKPGDRVLLLAGHDTNIATVAGALQLNWIIDGRANDTPPGGALVFELWQEHDGSNSVRVFYTAQTLDQMREAQKLTPANPPQRVPVFVPGCSQADMSCTLDGFAGVVRHAIEPGFVAAP